MINEKEDKSREDDDNEPSIEVSNEAADFESASVKPKQILVTDEELKQLQKELVDYKNKYLSLLADADNARKRLQKERQELTRYAVENLVIDFLRPLDNLENALRFAQDMSDEVRNWAFGFQMILAQFKDVIAQNGITTIESLGRQFNPHEHEAIEMIESEAEPGTIVEECIRGYKMGDRTIRPARVKVAKMKDESTLSQE